MCFFILASFFFRTIFLHRIKRKIEKFITRKETKIVICEIYYSLKIDRLFNEIA